MAQSTVNENLEALDTSLKRLGDRAYGSVKFSLDNVRQAVEEDTELHQLTMMHLEGANDDLKSKIAEKDATIDHLAQENARLRAQQTPQDPQRREAQQQAANTKRKPICARCWDKGYPCDLSPQCHGCLTAQVVCKRKICDNPRCEKPGCPRVHGNEYFQERRQWFMERGNMPDMDHRGQRALGIKQEVQVKDELMDY